MLHGASRGYKADWAGSIHTGRELREGAGDLSPRRARRRGEEEACTRPAPFFGGSLRVSGAPLAGSGPANGAVMREGSTMVRDNSGRLESEEFDSSRFETVRRDEPRYDR